MDIAIVAVAYNRQESLKRLLSSLEKSYYDSKEVPLIISIDKSNTDVVEKYADQYRWLFGNKVVDKHEKNLGLHEHMMSLRKWFDRFDALVVLEDDVVVSHNYYKYVWQTVEKYYSCSDIAGISLYGFCVNYQTGQPFTALKDGHDVYFMNCAMSWGEVWMKDSWLRFYDWYQSHKDFPVLPHLPKSICSWNSKSWLKYHTRYCIEENKYFVHPYISLSTNYSDKGEHWSAGENTVFQVPLQQGLVDSYHLPDFGSDAVYYDGFFENKSLYDVLGLCENELCIDLQSENHNRQKKRYWLTTEVADFKIVKSFGLNFRPIEQNILFGNHGNQIFLYNTTINERNNNKGSRKLRLYYFHLSNVIIFLFQYGLKNTWKDLCEYISQRIKK